MTKERINPATLSHPAAYTQVVTARGGKLIFLAGQTPINLQGEPVGIGDLRAQARQVYQNIDRALAAAGASFDDVVKMTAYIVNYSQESRGIIGEVRREFVSEPNLPAHTLLGVQALAREEYLLEVDTIAVVDGDEGPNLPRVAGRVAAGAGILLAGAALSRGLRRLFGKRD
jgi:enamine deaminase RidA (YjgF/YER057c/UK114 family)